VDDGFNNWDGTDYLYFHGGKMGHHSLWDSRLFNYSSYETLRFLLSNCAYYSEKFHFDGFRFDGITSILYRNHGIRYSFSGDYREYFSDNFDEDGGVYLMLANKLLHQINPEVITIAEDVSGMPGLCLTVDQGGFGFDYRLNMSVSDKWIQLLKEYKDEDWNLGNLVFTLTNRRYNEKHVGYCESHDQSIVGDKTIAMWLFDKEMYWNMSCNSPETIIISRGMALHKLIRLITFALGGEAYLCFMGNEFGHPEWVDFPRPGNGFSYALCRRRWDLCDNKALRYKYLYNWDVAMNKLDDIFRFISSPFQYVSLKHESDKVVVFEKGDLLFVFNFHSNNSYEKYKIGTQWGTRHKIVLDSDEYRFFGKGRLEYGHGHFFPIIREGWNNRPNHFNLYIPSRTCMVLVAEENLEKYDLSKFTFETIE
jgi:1,4-alpha-glucan branching enzyme